MINATSFRDLSDAFGVFSGTIAASCTFSVLKFKTYKLIEYIDDLEHTVNERMKKSLPITIIYKRINLVTEKLIKTLDSWANSLVFFVLVYQFTLSMCSVVFSGEDFAESLQLVFPMT